jgi:hypothetical protein
MVGGYGHPPDANDATNGTDIGLVYNGHTDQVFDFTDMSGNQVANYGYCGVTINHVSYNACTDPQIAYDRIAQHGYWIITYLAYPWDPVAKVKGDGGVIMLYVSNDGNPADGFWQSNFPAITDGCPDQPRLGYTTNKIVVAISMATYNGGCSDGSTYERISVADLTGAEAHNPNYTQHTNTYTGKVAIQPTTTTVKPDMILWEAPDPIYQPQGLGEFISGPAGTWTMQQWPLTVNVSYNGDGPFFAHQPPPTSVELDVNDGRFISATLSGNTAWAASNQQCSNGQLCPYFNIMNVDPNTGAPTTYVNDFEVQNTNGWNMYYPAIATTVFSTSIMGVVDYTYANGGIDPSSQGFQLSPTGAATIDYAGRQVGTTTATSNDGAGNARWGDYSGCDYVVNSQPAVDVCVGMWAEQDNYWNYALEVFTNQYS